jgi:hypothetical protein
MLRFSLLACTQVVLVLLGLSCQQPNVTPRITDAVACTDDMLVGSIQKYTQKFGANSECPFYGEGQQMASLMLYLKTKLPLDCTNVDPDTDIKDQPQVMKLLGRAYPDCCGMYPAEFTSQIGCP